MKIPSRVKRVLKRCMCRSNFESSSGWMSPETSVGFGGCWFWGVDRPLEEGRQGCEKMENGDYRPRDGERVSVSLGAVGLKIGSRRKVSGEPVGEDLDPGLVVLDR